MSIDVERAEKLRRGKLLLKLRSKLIGVKLDDEGDRVYLRSTNDADTLKEIVGEIDEYGWQEFVREKGAPDVFETCRKAVAECEALKLELERLREALSNLANAEALAGVRAIVAGWNGEGRADGPFQRHPSGLGAAIPKTTCGALYALDEAVQHAKSILPASSEPA